VDDNRSFAGAARLLLERQGERVVGLAYTSAEAVALVAELRPDVILVDLALGDESGLDVAGCWPRSAAALRLRSSRFQRVRPPTSQS
jgi:CheY-like chemotaxis protein